MKSISIIGKYTCGSCRYRRRHVL